jgi:hypothetical protein
LDAWTSGDDSWTSTSSEDDEPPGKEDDAQKVTKCYPIHNWISDEDSIDEDDFCLYDLQTMMTMILTYL